MRKEMGLKCYQSIDLILFLHLGYEFNKNQLKPQPLRCFKLSSEAKKCFFLHKLLYSNTAWKIVCGIWINFGDFFYCNSTSNHATTAMLPMVVIHSPNIAGSGFITL